jgi:hypothetical protein
MIGYGTRDGVENLRSEIISFVKASELMISVGYFESS